MITISPNNINMAFIEKAKQEIDSDNVLNYEIGDNSITVVGVEDKNVVELTIPKFVTAIQKKFFNELYKLKRVTVDISNINSIEYLFEDCSATEITISGISKCTNTKSMFTNCYNLQSVNFGGNNFANVTNMRGMFVNCEKLQDVDFSKFNI